MSLAAPQIGIVVEGWQRQVKLGYGTCDDAGLGTGAHLEAIGAEFWVFEELAKGLQVTLPSHVGQVRHHVRYNL